MRIFSRIFSVTGLSQSEMERYGASFVRFKDPDGPEMHKARLGARRFQVLPDHGWLAFDP